MACTVVCVSLLIRLLPYMTRLTVEGEIQHALLYLNGALHKIGTPLLQIPFLYIPIRDHYDNDKIYCQGKQPYLPVSLLFGVKQQKRGRKKETFS